MGSVAQFHDPEGDRLIHLAESLGGAENLSDGERWRLANTLDRRRKLEARAAQQSGRTDALDAQANERRFTIVEQQLGWAKHMLAEVIPPVIGEMIGEAEQRSDAEVKKLLDGLRGETDQKLNAQYASFERAVRELRDTDRATILSDLRETMSSAESRIDEHLETALTKTWERAELEIALVRDELLSVISEKQYGRLAEDDAAKHALAEKAIASLRKWTEAEGARMSGVANQIAGMANQLGALEGEHKKITKKLLVRCATTAVLLQKETTRADDLASKVERLETALEELTAELFKQKAIK